MLYYLIYPLHKFFFGFNVIKYITVRSSFAMVTSLAISVLLGPWVIRKLYGLKIGQEIRKEECLPLYALHKTKEGTPTMGGILVLFSVIVSTLLWSEFLNM
ncbi:MAG TPA: phospho-N-acetylmuramoyl-pentapeptide-transferase, partial [bacterium]|nr:phospho-N-acetylmuramoyl-pentapeptide-transferase [bacterium]